MPSSSRPAASGGIERPRTALGVELGLERGAADRPELSVRLRLTIRPFTRSPATRPTESSRLYRSSAASCSVAASDDERGIDEKRTEMSVQDGAGSADIVEIVPVRRARRDPASAHDGAPPRRSTRPRGGGAGATA